MVHVAIALASGIAMVFLVRYLLNIAEKSRLDRIEKLKRVQVISGKKAKPLTRRQMKLKSLENVGSQFTIIRRLIIAGVILIWLIIGLYPFLGDMPVRILSISSTIVGVVVGFAARPYIENLIGGILLSFSKKIRVGDTIIIDDNYGVVEDISMTHSVMRIWDWRRYVIPNSRMMNKEFINYTLTDSNVWAHIEFNISYDADLARVREIAENAARNSMHTIKRFPPSFWVMGMGENSCTCWLAAWTETPQDTWMALVDMRTELVIKLQEAGIRTHVQNFHFENSIDLKPPEGQG
ncbi:MAG: mechanosensitive ion channel family protein [Spirochaetales bacterium]|nr:mechanosensitive ion channel family protein [Spirochaetales bacterium]MCF7939405.1 mechanosensitive ion channel family protein [Spirochaetales bacterium]